MTTIAREAPISVQLSWDEAGFLWQAGAPVTSVAEVVETEPGRFVFTDHRAEHGISADAALRHEAVRAGAVLWCATHAQARLLARVLTAHGHLAHMLADVEPTDHGAWAVLTSCPLTDAPGGLQPTAGGGWRLRAVS
jgi:hypothetical protein